LKKIKRMFRLPSFSAHQTFMEYLN
jgi:hypothetical protein